MFARILAETRQRGNSDVTNLVAHKILSMGEAWSGEELKFQDRRLHQASIADTGQNGETKFVFEERIVYPRDKDGNIICPEWAQEKKPEA